MKDCCWAIRAECCLQTKSLVSDNFPSLEGVFNGSIYSTFERGSFEKNFRI